MERKLTAILAADVVGYSKQMADDEESTLTNLQAHRAELFDPKIAEHHGRIIKLMGDGTLVEFASVVDAVNCAISIQSALTEADSPICLRIGINLGDVIVDGEDIYGDGVNIAARLEGLADPGGVCISNLVYQSVRSKIDATFNDIGEQSLKNIDLPIQAWKWPGKADAPTDITALRALQQSEKPSIAILPFDNMSGDEEQEYFSDGITEDLITELSRFKDLAVVSRNSSFIFKGKSNDVREVGRKLNAQFVMEGSVRKAGNRVRVTAQLIDARNDVHVWAERYDRKLENIFEVQDDLVKHIASILVGRLEAEQLSTIKRQSMDQPKAYDLFLRGREHFFNWSIEENRKALDCLVAAIDIEPENAAALALLSEVRLRMWLNGWTEQPSKDLKQSLELAQTAVEIDDGDSRTQTALGMACLFNGNPGKAGRHLEKAIRINPNDTRVSIYYSRHAVFEGDTEKAVDLCRQAQTLNPYGKYNWNLGLASFVARDYRETIAQLDDIRNPPESVLALLAASYAMAEDRDKAAATYDRFTEAAQQGPMMKEFRTPGQWRDYYAQRWPFRNASDFEHLILALRRAGLPV